jgi:hypothetical protein
VNEEGKKMPAAIALSREKELRILEQAILKAENEGLQVLLRDPETRAVSCALCGAESDHPTTIRHTPICSYSRERS